MYIKRPVSFYQILGRTKLNKTSISKNMRSHEILLRAIKGKKKNLTF